MITNKRIPISYPINLIKWDLLFTILFSILIYSLTTFFFKINIPIPIAAFLGTAITLVLAFKLSQSYDRWWEARKIWGSIVNDSRTLVLQLLNFTNKENNHLIIASISNRQIAWCYILGQELRRQYNIEILENYINEQELSDLHKKKSIAIHLLNNQLKDISKLHKDNVINSYQQVQMDSTISRLTISMGQAERIKNTIFPKSYRLTLHFFIYLFLIILSFSLTDLKGFIEIPVMVFISLPFFLLEKIAFNMQDPFENRPTDTAMTTIARNIEINIKELLNESNIPEPLDLKKFYQL